MTKLDKITVSKIQTEIFGLEKKYWKAMIAKDIDSAISMTHFPCTVTGTQGARSIEEKEYRQMLTTSNTESYKQVELRDPQVEVWNTQTAMITYSTQINGRDLLDASTWIYEDGKWVCAFHSENPQKLE